MKVNSEQLTSMATVVQLCAKLWSQSCSHIWHQIIFGFRCASFLQTQVLCLY